MPEIPSTCIQPQKTHTNNVTNPIIETIIQQMGGRGVYGALAYVGASKLLYKAHGEYGYPSTRSRINEDGTLSYETGLIFRVNGKPGKNWTILVAYEPNDTYSVYLWQQLTQKRRQQTGKAGETIDEYHDVYCDNLKGIVENSYDKAIKTHNAGVIPL